MNEKKIEFTVIIPHYNIPDLLRRCIDSIPVREDIQVIVIDDCSPNATEYIPSSPKGKSPLTDNPFVEFYSTQIGGSAGRARNIGLDHAKGEWLIFLDSDDLLSYNAETLLDKYKDRPEDILFFQTQSVMNDDLSKSSGRNCFKHHFEKYFSYGDDTWLRYYFDALWGKLIKKEIVDLHHIRFEEIRYGNDAFFSISTGTFARKVAALEEVLYINTERTGSLTSAKRKSIEEWQIRYDGEIRILDFFDSHDVKFNRFGFVESLIDVSKVSKKIFRREFLRLSFRNKCRVVQFCAIVLKNKIKRFCQNSLK